MLKNVSLIKTITLILFINGLYACQQSNSETEGKADYLLISYLNIDIDSLGNLPQVPYVVDLENKKLVVFGILHSSDPLSPMFKIIEVGIKNFKPDVVIIEGGVNTSS